MQLQYKLDDTIRIDDEKYIVNAAFNVILKLSDMLEDTSLDTNTRVLTGLQMLINTDLGDKYTILEKNDILEKILTEYVQMEPKKVYDLLGNELPSIDGEDEQILDFNIDADYIFAAFMQVYGIDLIEQQGKLHWSKFNALLNGLPDGTTLSRIMGYRAWKEEDEKKDYKQFMREMKRKFKLGGDDLDV